MAETKRMTAEEVVGHDVTYEQVRDAMVAALADHEADP